MTMVVGWNTSSDNVVEATKAMCDDNGGEMLEVIVVMVAMVAWGWRWQRQGIVVE